MDLQAIKMVADSMVAIMYKEAARSRNLDRFDEELERHKLLIKLWAASELGLPLVTGLNLIHIIKGTPSLAPAGMIAVAQQKGLLEICEITADENIARAVIKRVGQSQREFTFTWAEAQKLVDTSKGGWVTQRANMLKWRVISRAFREVFPDTILGLYTPDEQEDISQNTHPTPMLNEPQPQVKALPQSTQPTQPAQPAQSEKDLAWQALCDIVDLMGIGEDPTTVWKMAIARYGKPMDNDVQGWRKWVTEFSADYQNAISDDALFQTLDKPSAPVATQPKPVGNVPLNQTPARAGDVVVVTRCLYEDGLISKTGKTYSAITMYWHNGQVKYMKGRRDLAKALNDPSIEGWVSGQAYPTNFEIVLGQKNNYLEVSQINPINPKDIPF